MDLEKYLKLIDKPENVEGWTTQELGQTWGLSSDRVRQLIAEGIAAGVIENCGRRNIPDISGKRSPRPCYRLTRKGRRQQ